MDIEEVKYWKHPSKTNCVFVNKKNSPLISIDIWCKAGISYEEKDKGGIAHFLEHMIFKGCNKSLPGEFDLKIESLGGFSNASTGYDEAHYYVLTPSANFKESLSLLSDLVLNPNLNYKEFNQEKSVVIEEIMQYYDQPDERIFSLFLKEVWIDHFYSKPILGNEELVKSISIKELRDFHSKQYVMENTCFAISGNLPTNVLEIFENCNLPFSKTDNSNKSSSVPRYKSSIKNGKKIIKLKNIEFSRIFKAWQIPENQKLLLAFEMFASVLCDGHNGKLIKPLREENHLVESIYADVHSGEFGNLFIIETSCLKKNLSIVEDTLDEILEDLFLKRNVSEDELKRASRMINSNYIFNLETTSQLTSYFGNNLLWNRVNPHIKFNVNIEYWSNIENFQDIFDYFTNHEFTLVVEKI